MKKVATKMEWYEAIADAIMDNLEGFYEHFYPSAEIKRISSTQISLEPCPFCQHRNCCRVDKVVHCFSGDCTWSGTHINAWYDYAMHIEKMSLTEAIGKLEEFFSIQYPEGEGETSEGYKQYKRYQAIKRYAKEFYYNNLISSDKTYEFKETKITPLNYLMLVRKRKRETIDTFKIGFTGNYLVLHRELMDLGYSKEEIKAAEVWAPEGLFIYHYHNPTTNDIVRFNTKNPFNSRFEKFDEFNKKQDGDIIVGFSVGKKAFLFSYGFTFNEDIYLVEGEHDLFSLWESGFENVACIGGNMPKSAFECLDKAKKNIYTCFDDDDAGAKYLELVDSMFADLPVYKAEIPKGMNDIDNVYTRMGKDEVVNVLSQSTPMPCAGYRIKKFSPNKWRIADRQKEIMFKIKSKDNKGSLIGQVSLYREGILTERQEDTSLNKAKSALKPFNFYLADYILNYFNSEIEKRSFDELLDIYMFSSQTGDIIKQLARIIHDAHESKREMLIQKIKTGLGHLRNISDIVDSILKEINDIQNRSLTEYGYIPQMKISQYFNVKNNDAYFYFTNVKVDGDVLRRLPFLLRNDGTLIRLDLLKRKDSQCLLLVDNKYELPMEVTNAIFDTEYCSLQQKWAQAYIDGEVEDHKTEPHYLVPLIESYIRKFYYTNDQTTYKILALYCYATYFYELFGQMPYLHVNGEKGSGKTVLNIVLSMFCFNSKVTVDISEAALFRMAGIEGGTIFLDEQENLTSRQKASESAMAAILKGGYARGTKVVRYNQEKNCQDFFDPFCPKIISNIFGLEDILSDRCIPISSYRLRISKETKMEDPKYYIAERGDEIKEITSYCCISALKHFQKMHKVYTECTFETNNARLSQILTPILAVAKAVDQKEVELKRKAVLDGDMEDIVGEYEMALRMFCDNTLMSSKSDTEHSTPEGIIKNIIPMVAREIVGLATKEYLVPAIHRYKEPIRYNIEEDWFEINVMHFKCFIEENIPGETVYLRFVPRWIKTCFNIDGKNIRRQTVNIENEDLIRELKGSVKVKVNAYKFKLSDFVTREEMMSVHSKNVMNESLDVESDLF